jgi:uncharacterized membrane protein
MNIARVLKHLFIPSWWARRAFTPAILDTIEAAIRASEQQHCGELRFVIEGELHALEVLRGVTARERALVLFSQLRVWDTHENSGVLIYVQCLDRAIEIVADRGIATQVAQAEWETICRHMEEEFRAGRYAEGAQHGISEITTLLTARFPATADNLDELPDRPLLM